MTERTLDLAVAPLSADAAIWSAPTHYAGHQTFADAAREAGCELFRHPSVRDPGSGVNVAVLTCRAFARPAPIERQSCRMHLGPFGAQAVREHPRAGLKFAVDVFAGDPCIRRAT